MKGLTLWQPYASAIAAGFKRYETRSFRTRYRGLIAIHAGKKWTRRQADFAAPEQAAGHLPAKLPLGAVIAVAELVSVRKIMLSNKFYRRHIGELEKLYGDWGLGRYAWQLKDVRPLAEPVPMLGKQGLFPIDTDTERLILEQIKRND